MRMSLAEGNVLVTESDPTNDVEGIDAAYKMADLEPVRFWDEYPI